MSDQERAQLAIEIQQLREQLAAAEKALSEEVDCVHKTLMQLTAEREKVQPLVGALKSVRKDNDELWTDVTTEWRAKLHHQIRTIIDAALAKVKK